MKILETILLIITMLLLLSSTAFANPMAGPADLIASTFLLTFALLMETGVIVLMLKKFNLRLARFGTAWFLVNLVSFLSFVYSVYLIKPYMKPYVGPLFPFFAGEAVVILGEGTILYFLTRHAWFRQPESQFVPLSRAYLASFIGNIVSIAVPFLHLPLLLFPFIIFWPTLIPVILLLLLFVVFIILKRKGHMQKSVTQIVFLVVILLISGTMIVLSLTGHYSLPTKEMRSTLKRMSFLVFSPSPSDLKDRNQTVRYQASSSLGQGKNPATVAPLIELLGDSDPEVRGLAAEALGAIGDLRAVDPIIICLKDTDSVVRWKSASALRMLKATNALQPLTLATLDEDEEVRRQALEAVYEISKIIKNEDRTEIKDQKEIEPVIIALKDKSPLVREHAAWLLLHTKDRRVVSYLIDLLKDEWPRTRSYAAKALGNIKDAQSIDPLISALRDDNAWVRESASVALGQFEDKKAVEPLIEVLKDNEANVRWSAAQALGKAKDIRATMPLLNALKNDAAYIVRENAAKSLGIIKDPSSVDDLISALRDSKQSVRKQIAFALSEIQTSRCDQILLKGIKEQDIAIIAGAYKYFLQRGIPNAEKDIIKAMQEFNSAEMADYLKNSNNQILSKAAESWINSNSIIYRIYTEENSR